MATPTHKPDDVVDTDDESILPFIALITSQCSACLHPDVATMLRQETIKTSRCLAFA